MVKKKGKVEEEEEEEENVERNEKLLLTGDPLKKYRPSHIQRGVFRRKSYKP